MENDITAAGKQEATQNTENIINPTSTETSAPHQSDPMTSAPQASTEPSTNTEPPIGQPEVTTPVVQQASPSEAVTQATVAPTPEPTLVTPVLPPAPLSPTSSVVSDVPSVSDMPVVKTEIPQKPRKQPKLMRLLIIFAVVLFAGAALTGSYLLGKSHEKIIIQAPKLHPIDLPPQAVVVEECAVGRGKQYILPKDIPNGPVYDVVNSKVIAIEYNLDLASLFTNSDVLTDTILKVTKEYPVNHFLLVPVTQKPGEQISKLQLIMFVVPKDEASKITCK